MSDTEMTAQIAAMEKAAKAAEAEASASELDEDALRLAEMRKREADARGRAAANARTKRENLMAVREMAAKARLDTTAIVLAIDLVALFPAGKAPSVSMLPCGGVVVVRDPPREASKQFHAEFEMKRKTLAEMYMALILASTVEPTEGIDAVNFTSFLEAKPDATITIGNSIRELGGSRSAADKRGGG